MSATATGAVSRLSPALRHRLVTEHELVAATLAAHPFARSEKFVQELLWRRYWKSWLTLRPSVWADYRADVQRLRSDLGSFQRRRIGEVEAGRGGVGIMDHFAAELVATGYLHNHARMWFAGWWVHTERLPWQLGADFFYRHLLDADPASNTLSWRWVAGLQTRGKPYLTCRSNVEKYAAELVAAHPEGLDRLGDATATPAPVDAADPPEAVVPDDADQGWDDLPADVGLWVHEDDLCAESAWPAGRPSLRAVFANLDGDEASDRQRSYRHDAVRDGLDRAATALSAEPTLAAGPLPERLTEWAVAHRLRTVVALHPEVGRLSDVLPTVRERLTAAGVDLRLARRPEDARMLPWARSGYFRFWQGAKDEINGRPRRDRGGRKTAR